VKPRSKFWTSAEIERLKKLAAEGASAARVAAALNRKMISVKLQAIKFEIRFPTLREQRKKAGA
jgi:hypothetical protein